MYDQFDKFQRAPTLGGECYCCTSDNGCLQPRKFQRAPTLGGECYDLVIDGVGWGECIGFNGHPPLGVNATHPNSSQRSAAVARPRFNGHPPLGVNATQTRTAFCGRSTQPAFQRAPTLGGECYTVNRINSLGLTSKPSFNGHPPLGVNATPACQSINRTR